jgi:hypothetical protein
MDLLNDRRAKRSSVKQVWPPNFGGYIWDHEMDGDQCRRPQQMEFWRLSELKKVLQSVWWNVKELLAPGVVGSNVS